MATPCSLDVAALELSPCCIMPGKYVWSSYGEAVIVLVQRLFMRLAKVAQDLANLSCWQEEQSRGLDRAAAAAEQAAIIISAKMCGHAKALRIVASEGIEKSCMAKLMTHQVILVGLSRFTLSSSGIV